MPWLLEVCRGAEIPFRRLLSVASEQYRLAQFKFLINHFDQSIPPFQHLRPLLEAEPAGIPVHVGFGPECYGAMQGRGGQTARLGKVGSPI
jgi:hypothetical protein